MSTPTKSLIVCLLFGCSDPPSEAVETQTHPVTESLPMPSPEPVSSPTTEVADEIAALLRSLDNTPISLHSRFEDIPNNIIHEVPSPTPVVELIQIESQRGHGPFQAFQVRLGDGRSGWVAADVLLLPTNVRPMEPITEAPLYLEPQEDSNSISKSCNFFRKDRSCFNFQRWI